MGRLTLRSLWARRRSVLGAGLAIVIGVAFLTATTMLGRSMTAGIDALFTEGWSGTDVQVRSEREFGSGESVAAGTIAAELVDSLGGLDAVAEAHPRIEGIAQLVGSDGEPIGGGGPPTIGTNWIESGRSPYELLEGRPPRGPAEVVIDSGAAGTGDLAVGDVTTVRAPAPREVTIVGIAELGSGTGLGGVTFTWFDTATAQETLLGDARAVTSVDLVAADGVAPDDLRAAVEHLLPEDAEVVTRQELIDEDLAAVEADFLGFFKTFLVTFAVIALLVATFSIHNTFSILVAQRTRETALLRAVGASRGQVLRAVTAEAVVLGAVAAAVGLVVGVGIATGLRALLDGLGFGVPTAGLALTTSIITVGLVVGIAATTLAAVTPAVRAARVAPLEAVRSAAFDRAGTSPWRALLGFVVTIVGVAAMALATSAGDGIAGSPAAAAALGAVVTLAGTVLLGPAAARVVAVVVGTPIARLRGTSGVLARRNAARHPGRTWSTAAALVVGTAVVALFASLATSIKQSFGDLVERSFGGDLVVYPEGFSGAGLDPELAGTLAEHPDVGTVAALSFAAALLDGRDDEPIATDLAALAAVVDVGGVEGDLAGAGDDGLAISRAYADDHGLGLGDELNVEFIDGEIETLRVGAIYSDDGLMGDTLLDARTWRQHTTAPEDFLVMVDLAAGSDLATVRAEVEAIGERFGDPLVEDRDEYLATQGAQIDQMLGLVYGLLGLAVLIGWFGIANTLSLSVHERTREIGLLRAVGQTRGQARSTVRWESVIVALFGTAVGLALGTATCWALVEAISASEGFGTFAPSLTTLAVVMVVAVVAGVLAAVRPARRAARLDVLAAIAAG